MRAQMEILGLVVIVVLFIFGGLIYLSLSSKPADTSLSETRQSAEVANLLNAMMKVTPCADQPQDSFTDIIRNCYLFKGSTDYCGNPDCRAYIKDAVKDAVKAYDSGWQYSFEVKESDIIFISDGSCSLPKKMAADSSIRFGKTSLHIGLVVCVK